MLLLTSALMVVALHVGHEPAFQEARPASPAVEQELIKLDQQLAVAQDKGDTQAVDRLLSDKYTYVDQTGRVGTKADALTNTKRAAPDKGAIKNTDYKVQLLGDTAVMTHLTVLRGEGELTEHLRAMHLWVREGNRWRIAAHQWTPISFPSSPASKPLLDAKCAEASFEPEVYQYYGDTNAIFRKLGNNEMGLQHRRAFMLLIETPTKAEVVLFERASFDDPGFRVSNWRGASLGGLREQLTSVILENRGLLCIGEQAIKTVKARWSQEPLGSVALPASTVAAFGHFVKRYGTEYMRVTAILLC